MLDLLDNLPKIRQLSLWKSDDFSAIKYLILNI